MYQIIKNKNLKKKTPTTITIAVTKQFITDWRNNCLSALKCHFLRNIYWLVIPWFLFWLGMAKAYGVPGSQLMATETLLWEKRWEGGNLKNKAQNKYSSRCLIPPQNALLIPKLCGSTKLARCGRNAKGIPRSEALRRVAQPSNSEGRGELKKLWGSDRRGYHPPWLTGILERQRE